MDITRTPLSYSRGPRIFIASEDTLEALAIETLLRNEHFNEIRVSTDVREITPMYVRWPFHLLILDGHSTLVSAESVLRGLVRPLATSDLSVLALINPGAEQHRLAALAGGATHTLSRPIRPRETVESVRNALVQVPMRMSSF